MIGGLELLSARRGEVDGEAHPCLLLRFFAALRCASSGVGAARAAEGSSWDGGP